LWPGFKLTSLSEEKILRVRRAKTRVDLNVAKTFVDTLPPPSLLSPETVSQ
jgi:hypothetical protein